MNYENVNKNKKINETVSYLFERFGESSFKVSDYWEADMNAIGLSDITKSYLVYIYVYDSGNFYVALENLDSGNNLPYILVRDFDKISLKELEDIVAQHLRIKA